MIEENPKSRQYNRKRTLVLLDVADASNFSNEGRAAVIDISMGGCAFESNIKLYENDNVILRFTVSRNKVYALESVVKRVRKSTGAYIYGVKFREMGFWDRIKLKKLISKISK